MNIKELTSLGPQGSFTFGNDNDLTNFLVRIQATVEDSEKIIDFLTENFACGDVIEWQLSNKTYGKTLRIGDMYINFNKQKS